MLLFQAFGPLLARACHWTCELLTAVLEHAMNTSHVAMSIVDAAHLLSAYNKLYCIFKQLVCSMATRIVLGIVFINMQPGDSLCNLVGQDCTAHCCRTRQH